MTIRRWMQCCLYTAVAMIEIGSATQAESIVAPEYTVKAGFLVAFVQYTTWPAQSFESADSPIIICVPTRNPFGDLLERTAAAQKSVRTIAVRRIDRIPDEGQCHIVFIDAQNYKLETTWLGALQHRAVLTVGDSNHAIEHGAVLQFVTRDERIRFEVNWAAMETAGIKLGSPLLQSALKVHRSVQVSQ
jgi:hypothetical protein